MIIVTHSDLKNFDADIETVMGLFSTVDKAVEWCESHRDEIEEGDQCYSLYECAVNSTDMKWENDFYADSGLLIS